MPSFLLPPGTANGLAVPEAGQLVTGPLSYAAQVAPGQWRPVSDYQLPDLHLRPRRRIALSRLYAPISLQAVWDPANPGPTDAQVTFSLSILGEIRFLYANTLQLIGPAGVGQAIANATVASDLVNPITVALEDSGNVGYELAFDAPVTEWFLYLSLRIPSNSAAPIEQDGTGYYEFAD